MEMHEAAEGNVAVRELLALTCVHNAKLSRSEFTSTLQSAMHWQELCTKEEKGATLALKGILLDSPAAEGPPTATAAYSRQSGLPRVGPGSMSHRSTKDLDGQELLEEAVDETADIRTGSHMDTSSKATQLELHLDDIYTHTVSAYQETQNILSALNGFLFALSDEETAAPAGVELRECQRSLEIIRARIIQAKDICGRAQGSAKELETGVSRMEQSSPSSRGAVGSTESIQPLHSVDAVRVALRKLDASRDATKTILDGLHTPPCNPRGRGFRGGRGRGRGGTRKKSVVPHLMDNNEGQACLVCKEGHNSYDNPVCKKKWVDYKSHLGDEASKFHSQGKAPDDDPG